MLSGGALSEAIHGAATVRCNRGCSSFYDHHMEVAHIFNDLTAS